MGPRLLEITLDDTKLRIHVIRLLSVLVAAACLVGAAADQAPISGPVKAVDPAAQTLTIEAPAKGKAR